MLYDILYDIFHVQLKFFVDVKNRRNFSTHIEYNIKALRFFEEAIFLSFHEEKKIRAEAGKPRSESDIDDMIYGDGYETPTSER